jgi:general secretion pathway protein G
MTRCEPCDSRSAHGFTLIEVIITLTVLAVIATAAIPTSRFLIRREKEHRLQQALLEMRTAIDRYRQAVEEGVIAKPPQTRHGYPADLKELVAGARSALDPSVKIRFLRKIPIDPLTGEARWGQLSVQNDPQDEQWGGENLFDVYSLAPGEDIEGRPYREW